MKKSDSVPYVIKLEGIEQIQITPKEAFIFSRINGQSTVKEIASITSFSVSEVYEGVQRLIDSGFVGFKQSNSTKKPEEKSEFQILGRKSQPKVEIEDTDLKQNEQDKINDFYQKIYKQSPEQILGLQKGFSEKELKKAFLDLVKVFHPDRFFGKKLGAYAEKIDSIFEEVHRANVFLNDQLLGKTNQDRELISIKAFSKRQQAAKKYFEMGLEAERKGQKRAALNFYTMAMTNDSKQKLYREGRDRLKLELDGSQIGQLKKEAKEFLRLNQKQKAAEIFEKILKIDLSHGECFLELVKIYASDQQKIKRALELGPVALEFYPKNLELLITLSRLNLRAKNLNAANSYFSKAEKIDSANPVLKNLKKEIQKAS